MDSRLQNNIEVFNEGFILLSNYLLIIFTEFVSAETRYQYGLIAIYLILIACAYNIFVVFLNLIVVLRLKYLKHKHKLAWAEYNRVNDKVVDFILRDFIKTTDTDLTSKEKHEHRMQLNKFYTFEKREI
jgi:hypothetical protein